MVQEAWTRGRAPLFLRLPCLAALSPLLLMRALERGFEEIVPFCPDARCPKRAALPVWERRIRALLERLGSLAPPGSPGPIRFRGEGISQSLSSTGKRIPAAPETEYPADAPPPLTGRARIDLARMISGRFGDTDLREIPLEGAALPYGDIRIDGDRCTLCGACARRCPTGALRLVEEEEIAIQFSHRACLACGACLSHCSEKALSLHRVLQPTPFREGAAVEKVRDEPARCRICGRVTGKKRLQEKVALQLRAAGFDLLADGIGLCRLCKNRAVYQESAEPAERPSVSSST
ncbi:MAG: 4Fe-4S binding protein, partial [Deltaproteobacteria bacterium]|nr:4Fe-4S binding protein [Deltaproteobacteria bacterium]